MASPARSRQGTPSGSRLKLPAQPAMRSATFLGALKATTMMNSKIALPAEIIDLVLEYLPIPDLLRCARASKRMQEMVYDDTRWVRRLQQMGCWNESQARRKGEEAMLRKLEPRKGARPNAAPAASHRDQRHQPSFQSQDTLFDAGWEVQSQLQPDAVVDGNHRGALNVLESAMQSTSFGTQQGLPQTESLHALEQVRSIRGTARQEYGKVHVLLQPFYSSVTTSPTLNQSTVFVSFPKPEDQATILAQLRRFSKADTVAGALERRSHLENVVTTVETVALSDFKAACSRKEFDASMRQYAHVLVALDADAIATKLYIDQSRIIQDSENLGYPGECLDGCAPGHVDLGPSRSFFSRLSILLDDERSLIERIFPTVVDVFTPLLRRVEEVIISEYLTTLFKDAFELNIESYLKAVGGVLAQTLDFTQSLTPPQGSADEFAQHCLQVALRFYEPHVDLFMQSNIEFFNKRCFEEVESWNKQLLDKEASAETFYMSHVSRQAAKQDFLSSFKKVLMMPVAAVSTGPKSAKATAAVAENFDTDAHPGFDQAAPTTELAAQTAIIKSKLAGIGGLLSLEVSLTLVHTARGAIERTANFIRFGGRYGQQAKAQCQTIFVELLKILSTHHIQIGFDKAIDALSRYNAREATEHGSTGVKPLVMFLELVNVGDLIQQMVDVFYMQELVTPKMVDSDDFLSPTNKGKKRFEQALDESVAAGLSKGIDVLMDEVEYLCATTQSTADFNPDASTSSSGMGGRRATLVMDIGPTKTSLRIVELVSTHTDMLVGSTDKNMLDVFNQEVGLRLFTVLCKHLKRQRISSQGAINLISDTNMYFEYVKKLKNKELLRYFTALREVSQMFLVDGAHGKEIATIIADGDRYHGIFRAEEVYEFAERRADWYMIKGNVERAMYGAGCSLM